MVRGEYLLEVRAEEIPARMLEPAVKQLAGRLFEELMTCGVGPSEVETGFTPRRLTVVLRGLPAREPDREEQVVGPPSRVAFSEAGEPTPALEGFARRCGLPVEKIERVQTDKGEYVAALQKTEGRPTPAVLAEMVPRLIGEISWAKSMVWGEGYGPWARPIHGLVSLFEGEVVPFELFGIAAGRTTCGHPVLSPESFEIGDLAEYRSRLDERSIEIRPDRRREVLTERMAEAAGADGGRPVADEALLDKLVAICEIPGVLEGAFDPAYLELPREVLTTSLRDHQSAFSVENEEGELLPVFLTVMDRPDDPQGYVRSGNEWVVEARLADARFFFQEDRKRDLGARTADLEHLTFHVKLGSYADKAERLAELSRLLCDALGWPEDRPAAERAAALLKVDLTTEMVKEFTSLQGIMGGLYAAADGEPEEVWQAIYDQYLPASSDDPIPRGRVGRVAALADRIDTLVGIFGLGLVPTGSRDPFGLRRAAQGAVRIALEGELPLDLDLVAAKAARLYGDRLAKSGEQVLELLRPFVNDRVRYVLGQAGYAYDEIEAGLAAGSKNLPDLKARVDAVAEMRQEKDFLSLVLSAKRIVNIVKEAPEHAFDDQLLADEAEKTLHAAFRDARPEIEEAAEAGDYLRGLQRIAGLAPDLDRFFNEVLVMAEDEKLRRNRIALLQSIQRLIDRTARLTEVVVDKAEHRARFGD